jgi:peptidoglycan/xylan/chitin deacetylase (PgdA/CDA1 family)
MRASVDPPAGLKASQVPMFVMLGFDDNYRADGINWIVDTLLGGKKNPDGSAVRATFFVVGGGDTTMNGGVFNNFGGQSEDDLAKAWSNAYMAGHDIGDHTWDHADGGNGRVLADWTMKEIQPSHDFIKQTLNLPDCAILSWRFPFLHFDNDGFTAIDQAGYRTDASVEFGYDYWDKLPPPYDQQFPNGLSNLSPEYGKHFWWPFTLDNGFDPSFMDTFGVGAHAGLWEFPVFTFRWPDTANPGQMRHVTGLDFNVWSAAASDKTIDFCTVLKGSLDERLAGNRSPLNAGMHSDIYSMFHPDADATFMNTGSDRRSALSCFVDYALTKPDVRLVTFKQVVEWMRKPYAIH